MSKWFSWMGGTFHTLGGDIPIPAPRQELSSEEIAIQYDRIGEDYVEAQRRFIAENGDFATDFLLEAVGDLEGKKLLDVGCGSGDQLALYESKGAQIGGVEPSRKMLEIARAQIGDEFYHRFLREGRADRIPFNDKQFDVVTARLSLHYLPNLDGAWEEIGRVIRPSGTLAFVAPHPFNTFDRNEAQNYKQASQIDYRLLGSVDVVNYHHPFGDYLSPAFFERFTVEDFTEFPGVIPRVKDSRGPSAFGVKARRKE